MKRSPEEIITNYMYYSQRAAVALYKEDYPAQVDVYKNFILSESEKSNIDNLKAVIKLYEAMTYEKGMVSFDGNLSKMLLLAAFAEIITETNNP